MKEGWKYVKLGDAIDHLRTGLNPRIHFKLNTQNAKGYYITVRELQGFDFQVDEKTDRIDDAAIKRINERSSLKIGDVLYSGTGTIGRTAIVQEEPTWWNIKEGVYALTPKNNLDSKFLIYTLRLNSIHNTILSKSSGTTIKSIPMKELVKIEIPLPSLPEQQQIVDFLDAEFAKIDELKNQAEQSLQNAKDLFQAALKEMLTPKEGWARKKFSDVYDVRDGTHDSPKYIDSGYPLVTSKNLKGDYVDLVNVKYISEADYLAINERSKVDVGDILFAMIGTIGNATLVEEEPNYAIKNMALFKVPSTQSSMFLKYILNSQSVLEEMHSKSKGTTQSFVSLGYLRNFEISIPPKEEQDQIVSQITGFKKKVDILQSNYTRTIQLCADLKQALLRQVFE